MNLMKIFLAVLVLVLNSHSPGWAQSSTVTNADAAAPDPAPPAESNVAVTATPTATNAPPASAPNAAAPAEAPPTTSPSAARNIRFQFDGIPYTDVLERFAQMVNKPLITETNLQGSLTFNDPQPYTYQEALDTLNLMLSMKHVMLTESGHYLRLVPFKELPQMPLKILRGLDQTGDIRPGEVVTVVLEIKNLDAKEISEAVLPMLSNAGSIAPLTRGNGLIITDRLSSIQRIRYLLSQIDTESVVERQMKTFTLLHASGAVVADLINRTFGLATAPKRTKFNPQTKGLDVLPPDPNDYATAVYDDASRTLVLFGPRERVALAESLINRFEDKEGGHGGEVRIYYPQITKAEDLADMIRQAVPGVAGSKETAASASTKARLIVDSALNRLIVAAPIAGQIDAIENLINQVDKPVHGQGANTASIRSQTIQLTKVFQPRTADANSVAKILTQALSKRLPTGVVVPTANVSVETGSQSVVVSGSPGEVQTALDIVSQLETGSTLPFEQQTRFLDVGGAAEAKRLQPLLEQLYRNQVSDGYSKTGAHAKIITDEESGRLIVTASEDHLQKIETLIKQLRADRPKTQPRRLQIVTLKNVPLESVLKNITDLVKERMNDKRFEDVTKPLLLPDSGNNRLLVTATDEQLKEIEQVVSVFDVLPEKSKREMTVIPLQVKPAAEIITLVSQLMAQLAEDPANPARAPKLLADPSGKQIIVLATAKDLERVRALIQQFDTTVDSSSQRQFRALELFSRNAAELSPLVQQLYQEQLKGQSEPPGGPATLLAETKNNRIMVSGTEKEIQRVEAIIRQLDPEGKKGAPEETRVIRLKTALAADLVGLIEKSLSSQAHQVKVLVDARSNSLVLTGESGAVEAAAQIIQQLDTKSEVQPRELRILELKAAEASTLTPLVTSLFADLIKDRRGASYVTETKIVSDNTGNRILITGPKEELAVVADLIEQLDRIPEQGAATKVFKLSLADAETLAPIVSNAMLRFDTQSRPIRRVTVSPDEKSNSLIVSGPRADLQDASVIIERLDGETTDQGRALKIIPVTTDDADQLATLASQIFTAQNGGRKLSSVTITPEPSGKRLIVLAPASLLPQVEAVITSLDQPSDQGPREFTPIDLKKTNADLMRLMVNRIYEEQNVGKTTRPASIYADSAGTRLTVYGTKDQAALIQQIVNSLEGQAAAPRETKVFETGKQTEAQRLLPLVQELYRDRFNNDPAAAPADAQMITDGKTGRIIVSARTEQLKAIDEIFAQLQTTATNQIGRETRTFDVGTPGDVQRLLPLVQQLYQDQWKDRSENDPPDAKIVADPNAGRIIVSGKPDHIKQIEAILLQFNTSKAKTQTRDTRIFDLTTANAMDLSTTVRTLYQEQSKTRLGSIPADTLIVPDASANRIIVVGDTSELEVVESIITKLDKISTQSATVRVFKLKSADPQKVSEILSTALVKYDAYGRMQKRVSVVVDEKSRTLIATGDQKELQGVSVIIEQLDLGGAQPERKMKVVPVKTTPASDLSQKVRQLYQDQVKSRPELSVSDILIMEDTASNQLILAGSDTQLELIEKIITELQSAQVNRPPRETRLIDIGPADELQRLQPLVQQLYQERWKGQGPSDPPDAQIITDQKNGRFIVTGQSNHIAQIEAIIQQLRAGKEPGQRDTRIYDLTAANAMEISTTVRSLYQEQAKSRPGVSPTDTLILPDVSSNRLIVSGATNELDIVEDIIKKLDKVSTQSATVRVFKLKSADPQKVSEILSSALVKFDSYGRSQKRVSVVVDAKSRTLIATGDAKELQGVQVIIEQLDSLGEQPERKMTVLPVTAGLASELSAKVKQIYQDQVKSQPELGTTDALIMDDTTSNQLLIAGTEPQTKLIEEIVSRLQANVVTQTPRETKIFETGSPEQAKRLLPLVQKLYQDHGKGKEASDPADAQFITDDKTGRLIVSARPEHLLQIEQILATVNTTPTNAEPIETKVYELSTTTAAELATTVKSLYQEQLKTRPNPPATPALILPDTTSNRLVVSGSTNELNLIDALVNQLDKTSAQSGRTRVIKLKQARAEQLAMVITNTLVQLLPYGRSLPRVTVGADPANNLLILSGEPKELQSAAAIIEQMDAVVDTEPRQMQVIPLKSGTASEIATKVKQLYLDQVKGQSKTGAADALILGDDTSNRLLITAGESHLQVIQEIVSKIQEAGEGAGRQLRVYQLERNSANSLAAMISQMYSRYRGPQDPGERVIATASSDDRTLVIDGPGRVLERIDQVIRTLNDVNVKGAIEVRTYQFPDGNAADLAQTLERLFTERRGPSTTGLSPRFEADPQSSVLIVAATKDQFVQITQLIDELKKTPAIANEIRTFTLKNGDPIQIATVLEDMLSDNVAPGSGQYQSQGYGRTRFRSRPWGAGAGDNKSVRVAPATSLNAVVVQGPPEKLLVAEKLIQTLDRSDTDSQTTLQTVHLQKARATEIAQAVGKIIAGKGQTRLQRVSVTGVETSNSLLINGPSDAVAEVLKIVRELDQESTDEGVDVKIFKLEHGKARDLSSVISQLLQSVTRAQTWSRGSSRVLPATVSVDDRSNSLVISGTPSHFKVVEQVLSNLDKVPEQIDRDVHFVWLRHARAMDVADKIQAVYETRPEEERPVIQTDLFSNLLTVIASQSDLAQIDALISRLDESVRDNTIQVRMLPLSRIPAEQMVQMLTNIYPQMSAAQIRTVDKLPPPPLPTPTGMTPVRTNQMTNAISITTPPPPATNALPEVVIAIDKTANALILSGPASELDQIDLIVTELTFGLYGTDIEFRVFALKEADPVVMARMLNELFKMEETRVEPQQQKQGGQGGEEKKTVVASHKIMVVAEQRTRSVIVRAKPTDFVLLESLIKQLDVSGVSAQLEHRVVILTNAPPEKILPLVQQMVTQLNLLRPGEPLTVTADPRSHGLLVVARDTLLNQVETMIHSLDAPSIYAEAEVLVISLKQANASQLTAILQNLLKPGAQGEVTPEARELQEQVRRLKVQNDQGQSVLLDLTKPIKIMADPIAGAQKGGNRILLTSTPDNLKAMAAVIAMMDTVPIIEGVEVKMVQLRYSEAAIMAQTLTSIFTQGQRLAQGPAGVAQPEGTAGKALVNPLNVAVDNRSNTLILSGQKESLELALKVISDLDRQTERFVTEVKLFRLQHASATRIMPLLRSVFTEGAAVAGTDGLAAQVTRLRLVLDNGKQKVSERPSSRPALLLQADNTSNILIVAARSDTLPLLEEVIKQLDIPAASGLDTVRIFPLKHADAPVLQKIINDLHSGPKAALLRAEDKPNVTIDNRTNALIVSGNEKAFAIIEGLLAQLDRVLPFDLRDIRIIPLDNADATTVAATLQRLLDARITQKAALNKQEADTLKVIVLADARSNSLLVSGSQDSFELVETLTQQLDHASPALSGVIRLVPLNYADARSMAATLTSIFTQRYAAARTPDVARNRPVIVADPRSNSLMVAAGMEDNQALDDLLAKLDRKIEDPNMTIKVIPLKHNDCARVATMLEGVFTARLRSRSVQGQGPMPQEQVNVSPESLNNALVIYASKENHELIKELLEQIDVEPEVFEGLVQTFTLEYADAQRVATMLRTLVQQGLYRPGGPAVERTGPGQRRGLALTVDPRSNTLIVSASPENLQVVKEIIKRVDTPDFTELGNIRMFTLKHAKASSLSTVIEQFFRAKRTAEATAVNAAERTVPVTVLPDDRSNVLLVTGGKESFDAVERIIAQLDGEDTFVRLNFRVFPLKQATAAKLQSTLRQIFANRPVRVKGETPDPITIVADSWVNALIVGASVEDLSMVSSLIDRLDNEPSDAGIAVHVFPLAKADARRIAQTVQALYREGTPGVTLPVAVNADERMNAIIVSAGEADAKRIGELVKKLDTDQVARVSEIKVFPLRYARADSMSTILNTALNTKPVALTEQSPNTQSLLQFITRTEDGKQLVTSALKEAVLITPDTRMNSLIISGPVDYMGLLEQIITRLDSSSPQTAKIKVFSLQNAHARQMSDLLMSLFRMQPAAAAANQRSIQYTLVKPLEDVTTGELGEQELASATMGTAEQNALVVTVDPRTNSLLVGGTEHYVNMVSEIIQTLDNSRSQERKSEVIRLKNAQAIDLATAVRTFLDQDRLRITQVLGADVASTAQQMMEREASIVAEQFSNALLISAHPLFFPAIKELIDQLDQPQSQVLIQLLLAEVTLDSDGALGIEWNTQFTRGSTKVNTGTDFGVAREINTLNGYSALVTGNDFNFLLRAYQNDGRLHVLSRPQILTADNQPATINVVQRVPLVTDSRTTAQGDTINSFRYENVGVNLMVTPRISVDGFVTIDIGTTNSTVSSSTVDVSPDVKVPIINERRASTTVTVQSGQTVLFGGLIATVDDMRTKHVPVLGKIPYLGALFRSNTKNQERKELLILLTPQVLNSMRATEEITSDIGTVTREQLEKSGLRDQLKYNKRSRRDDYYQQLLEPLYPDQNNGQSSNPAKSLNEFPPTKRLPGDTRSTTGIPPS